jgi:hypothetical protein
MNVRARIAALEKHGVGADSHSGVLSYDAMQWDSPEAYFDAHPGLRDRLGGGLLIVPTLPPDEWERQAIEQQRRLLDQ